MREVDVDGHLERPADDLGQGFGIDQTTAQRPERLLEAPVIGRRLLGGRLLHAQRVKAAVHETGEAGQLRGADPRPAQEHHVAFEQRPNKIGREGRPFVGEAQ